MVHFYSKEVKSVPCPKVHRNSVLMKKVEPTSAFCSPKHLVCGVFQLYSSQLSANAVSHSPSVDAVTMLSIQAHISHATTYFSSPTRLSEKLAVLVLADACNRISLSLLESLKRVEAKQPFLSWQVLGIASGDESKRGRNK